MNTPIPTIPPRVTRAIAAMLDNRGTMTAKERIERFSGLVSLVMATDPGIEDLGLPEAWDTMTTPHRISWARTNWLRIIGADSTFPFETPDTGKLDKYL